jgi:exodeoxyribonuclease VII large subunit
VALRTRAATSRARLEMLAESRVFRRPLERVQLLARGLDELSGRLSRATRSRAEWARRTIESKAAQLESLSPLAVLGRGYTATTRPDGQLLRQAADLRIGDEIVTRFVQGQATSRIEAVANNALSFNGESSTG